MKKIFIPFLIVFILTSCSMPKENINAIYKKEPEKEDNSEYVKSVWMTYYELEKFTKHNNEKKFRNEIDKAFKRIKDMGFNTLTVQVRPFADAFYVSDYFPSSKYCFSVQGADMPYDPLKIMCESGKKHSLKIEAWLNPYRISNSKNIDELCDSHIAKKWYNKKKTRSNVCITKKGIYFNPASESVTKLIVNGVKEIVKNYDVYAVHFDDYFYPVKDKNIDKKEYKRFINNGGKLSLFDFRRKCVSDMVKSVYKAVKSINEDVVFGISPASDINENYNVLYADVEKWASEKGYVDYICPQVYFGFKNVYQPFMFTVKKWKYITNCDLYVGLPLYKSNKPDKYAAKNDKEIINEFVNNKNIISRQIVYLEKIDKIKGFYIFSYSCLFDERCKEEVENMLKVMNNHPSQ